METIPCIFGLCPRNTRKWKQIHARRNALERINARIGRDFLFNDRFIRGKASMQLHIAGSMAMMMAIAVGCLEKNKPDKIATWYSSPPEKRLMHPF